MADMDHRINSPSYQRNIEPIKEVLLPMISGREAKILEVGSGSGQHITALAANAPDARFIPSDPDAAHRRSITVWTAHLNTINVEPPMYLDASEKVWLDSGGSELSGDFDLLFSFNVVHITPIEVAHGLIAGAAKYLKPGGKLVLYGPFKVNGIHTAPSNQQFDISLRSRDPSWGVRDIEELEKFAGNSGLSLKAFHKVPANNFMPVFHKHN